MIITSLGEGLGNQLFQYSAARYLSHLHHTELKMNIAIFETYKLHKYSLQHFNIKATIATGNDMGRTSFLYVEPSFHYDPFFKSIPDNVIIRGHWQSEKYFKDIEDIIRHDLRITSAPSLPNRKLAQAIKSCNSISLHIRRCDYVNDPNTFSYHGICGLDYYEKCIEEIVKQVGDPHFFVFSDDPEWAIDNLKTGYFTTFINHNNADNNFEDLRLMSLCKHNIIANSTFSWWGAWLNTNERKIVLAPKNWFKEADLNTKDLIPSKWLMF
ncbi:alpha-1,2-fucosyltransferase [Pedobacter sp. AW31-3R]|uniref:alpha-1,2-fucosyltransferase n=1 Tax=Pedobacter sp. AW31-3R TaxID=3445781 RepID=UPI003FA0EB8C